MSATRPTTTPALFTGARGFETSNILKICRDSISFTNGVGSQITHFHWLGRAMLLHQGQQIYLPTYQFVVLSIPAPTYLYTLNINEVNIKSKPNTASDEVTTVLVVA